MRAQGAQTPIQGDKAMQLVRLAMLIYTVLLMATIVTVFLVNRRCNRLNCGIPM